MLGLGFKKESSAWFIDQFRFIGLMDWCSQPFQEHDAKLYCAVNSKDLGKFVKKCDAEISFGIFKIK